MATDRTDGDSLQGFLVPDSRLSYWAAQSSGVTEADPYPGAVRADRATSAQLTATGTPENADTLQLLAIRGGITAPDGAQIVWRDGTSGDYRGYEPPLMLADFETPGFTNSVYGYRHPSVLALPDGRVLLAVDAPSSGAPNLHRVQIAVRSAAGVWGSWTTIHSEIPQNALTADYLYPRLVERAGGVIDLYHVTYQNDRAQVQRWSSTDGTTWDVDSSDALPDHILISSREVRGIEAAYGAGQWLLQVWTDNRSDLSDEIEIYASRDGATFEDLGTISNESRPACIYAPLIGRFLTASRDITGPHYLQLRESGSAFGAALTAATSDMTGSAGRHDDECALTISDDGTAWLIGRADADTLGLWHIVASTTAETPTYLGTISDGDQENHAEFSAHFSRGQLLLASQNDEGIYPNSAAVSWFGGWSTVTMPDTNLGAVPSWDNVWLPVYLLDSSATFTLTTTGTPTASVNGEFLNNTGTASDDSRYNAVRALSADTMVHLYRFRTNGVDSRILVKSYASNGTDRYGIQVYNTGGASVDTLELRDDFAAGTIASATVAAGSVVEILSAVSYDQTGARVYYRVVGGSNEDRVWTLLGSSSSLTNDTTSGDKTKDGIEILTFATGAATAYDCDFGVLCEQYGGRVSERLILDTANPADLRGREISTAETYIHDGVSVRAAGLMRGGDSWQITPQHSYSLEYALPTTEPSPARGWRSTGTGAATIAWQLDSIADANLGPLVAVYLDRHNLDEITIQTSTGTSSPTWTTRYSGKLTLGDQAFQRAGSTVLPRSIGDATEDRIYLLRGELENAWLEFISDSTKSRQILKSSEGAWNSGATVNQFPALQLDAVDDTEPSSGNVAAGVRIHPRRTLILMHAVLWREISGIRIQIAGSAPPPQGYWEVGTMAIGAVHVLGWRPDSTRSRVLALGETLEAQADGSAYARRQREDLRRVEISWSRSSPTFETLGYDQDFVKAKDTVGALAVAARYIGPQSMRGLLREVGRSPIVYIPRIPFSSDDSHLLIEREAEGSMLCRFIPESYRLESIGTQLPEESGEVLRSSVITLEECI